MKRKSARDKISKLIEDGALDIVLVNFSGILGWIVKPIAKRLYRLSGDKIIRWGLREGMWLYDTGKGAYQFKKMEKAKDENDSDTFWDVASGI